MVYVVERTPGEWKASREIAVYDSGDLGFEPSSASETAEVDADCRKQAWARLLAKIYEIDPFACPKCGSEMKVIAIIQETEEILYTLAHLVKIAGGGAPMRRPAFASRLRSHFTKANEHHDPVASFRASTEGQASGRAAPSALLERETCRVEYARRRIRRSGDRKDADTSAVREKTPRAPSLLSDFAISATITFPVC